MELRGRIVLVCLWIGMVVLVGAISSAQSRQVRPDAGPVISGGDIGFRPEGWQGKARTGTFVVRINGEWVEAIPGAAVRPAATR